MPVTQDLTPLGTAFVLLATLILPLGAVQAAQRTRTPGAMPNLTSMLRSLLIQQAILVALSLATARAENVMLFPPPHFGLPQAGMAAAFLAVSLSTVPWRWASRTPEQKLRMLWRIPNQPSDVWKLGLIALGAGISEEMFYRGVMFQLWQHVLGSFWGSVAICVAAFALAHAFAGLRAILIISVMALASHLIVRSSGDLYTMMGIHAIYDVLAGIMFWQLARRDGLIPARPIPATEEGAS